METQDAVLSIDIAASRKILRQLRETEAADEFSNDFYFDDSDDYEDEDLFQVADSNQNNLKSSLMRNLIFQMVLSSRAHLKTKFPTLNIRRTTYSTF